MLVKFGVFALGDRQVYILIKITLRESKKTLLLARNNSSNYVPLAIFHLIIIFVYSFSLRW